MKCTIFNFQDKFLPYLLHNFPFSKYQKNQVLGPKMNQISIKSCVPKLHSPALPMAASSPLSKWFTK